MISHFNQQDLYLAFDCKFRNVSSNLVFMFHGIIRIIYHVFLIDIVFKMSHYTPAFTAFSKSI